MAHINLILIGIVCLIVVINITLSAPGSINLFHATEKPSKLQGQMASTSVQSVSSSGSPPAHWILRIVSIPYL